MFLSWSVPGSERRPAALQCLTQCRNPRCQPSHRAPQWCLLTNILWQKFVFFKCELPYFPTLGSTQNTAIECGMLRWENVLVMLTSPHLTQHRTLTRRDEGGRRAAASPGWRANLWHHMGQTGRQWEEDAGINEMRNPIWSTCQAARQTTRLYSERTSSISSPINMDLGKLFGLGRAGIILYIFIDNLSSTLRFYSWSLWRAM